ncbi:uncharacterized protein B0P05DRAFT_571502 [Gilbertella persicaria]|uniref:uncharacterized protein n=1 Tax=Gilbertella persicaria TaxID=101096 RepID=UPI00221F0FC9|nr:uncharacterized protein B0P05DRAFT_571502 [Gilbertella persicaria]KAI8079579.1 hypothetical protein B0P05DRAFT_571502 [Gilbertella persicaria]
MSFDSSGSIRIDCRWAIRTSTAHPSIDLPVFTQRKALNDSNRPAIPQVVRCKTEGQLAITYSEGPSDTTARIARQLNNASTPANFFVNIKWLQEERYATVLQNLYKAGHFIGMTYSLPTNNPSSMTDKEIQQDIIHNADMIHSILGVAPKYVRLHFSAHSDIRTEYILKQLGFVLVGYNLDGKDYLHKTPEFIGQEYERTFTNYKTSHQGKGSFISIQYDIPETGSLDAVSSVMKIIYKEGYTPVRMDTCLNDLKPYKVTAAGLDYVSDTMAKKQTQVKSISPAIVHSATVEPKQPEKQTSLGSTMVSDPIVSYFLIYIFYFILT